MQVRGLGRQEPDPNNTSQTFDLWHGDAGGHAQPDTIPLQHLGLTGSCQVKPKGQHITQVSP